MLREKRLAAAGQRKASAGPLMRRFDELFGQKFFEDLQGICAERAGNCDELYENVSLLPSN
jgi:hypothetical protein